MALHFSRVGPATADLEIWSASKRGLPLVTDLANPCERNIELGAASTKSRLALIRAEAVIE